MKESYFNCNKDSNNVVDNSKPSKKNDMPVLNEGSYFGSKLFDMCVLDEDINIQNLAKELAVAVNNRDSNDMDYISKELQKLPSTQQAAVTGLAGSIMRSNGKQFDPQTIDKLKSLNIKVSSSVEKGLNNSYIGAGETVKAGTPTSMWDSFKNALSGAWNHTADSFKNVFKFDGSATTGQYATVGALIAAGALGTYWLWKKFKKNGKLTEQDYKQAEAVQREAEQRKASGNYDANKQLAL